MNKLIIVLLTIYMSSVAFAQGASNNDPPGKRCDAAVGDGGGLPTMVSPKLLSGTTGELYMIHVEASIACREYEGECEFMMDGECDSTPYNNWRLPTQEELTLFEGMTDEDNIPLWTRTVFHAGSELWVLYEMNDGDWRGNCMNCPEGRARCVR